MADDYVQVAVDGAGKRVDNTTETTGAGTVYRQRVSIGAAGGTQQLAIDGSGQIGVNNFPASFSVTSMTAGTVTAATVTSMPAVTVSAATVTSMPSVTFTAGTVTSMPSLTVSAATVTSDTITAGTVSVNAATVTAPLPAGTNAIGTVTANQGTGSSANPWTIQGQQPAATTVAISSSASSGSVGVSNMNVVTAVVTANTALSGMSAVFEGTADGSNWVQLQGGRTDTSIIENGPTSIASANTPRAWDIPVGGLTTLRWRTTALGAGAATVSLAPQTLPYDPAPSVGLSNVGGTTVSAVAKGTQAANALGVQDFKDSGRTPIMFNCDRVAGVTSEALLSVTINKNGTTTSASTYSITSGKTLRIQGAFLTVRATSTTTVSGRVRLRWNNTASATSATPILIGLECSSLAALAESSGVDDTDIPDGLEIPGGTAIAFSQVCSATSATVSLNVVAFEY